VEDGVGWLGTDDWTHEFHSGNEVPHHRPSVNEDVLGIRLDLGLAASMSKRLVAAPWRRITRPGYSGQITALGTFSGWLDLQRGQQYNAIRSGDFALSQLADWPGWA
jgi:hypothetical protein